MGEISSYIKLTSHINILVICALSKLESFVSRLSEELLEKHSEIPWYAIKAMRNLHAHDYDNINFEIVWETLTKDIPELKDALQKIII